VRLYVRFPLGFREVEELMLRRGMIASCWGPSSKVIRVADHDVVVHRHELTDQEWELPAPLIPRASTGRPRVKGRQVIGGMVCKIRTGISWRDLPERRRWCTPASAATPDGIDRPVRTGSTTVRVHQHVAACRQKGRHQQGEPDDHALGR